MSCRFVDNRYSKTLFSCRRINEILKKILVGNVSADNNLSTADCSRNRNNSIGLYSNWISVDTKNLEIRHWIIIGQELKTSKWVAYFITEIKCRLNFDIFCRIVEKQSGFDFFFWRIRQMVNIERKCYVIVFFNFRKNFFNFLPGCFGYILPRTDEYYLEKYIQKTSIECRKL